MIEQTFRNKQSLKKCNSNGLSMTLLKQRDLRSVGHILICGDEDEVS